jgi:sugar (pentulose or hexulose) kinase
MSTSMASATGLFDLHARAWDQELLETLGVDPEQLPEISDAPSTAGIPRCSTARAPNSAPAASRATARR